MTKASRKELMRQHDSTTGRGHAARYQVHNGMPVSLPRYRTGSSRGKFCVSADIFLKVKQTSFDISPKVACSCFSPCAATFSCEGEAFGTAAACCRFSGGGLARPRLRKGG